MDLDALADKMRQAREFEVPVGAAKFLLRLPTPGEYRLLAGPFTVDGTIPDGNLTAFERKLAEAVLVGWSGLQAREIFPDAEAEPLAFSATTARLLLEYRVDIQDLVIQAVVAEKRKRNAEVEADQKNSRSGSPGKETSARRAA